MPDHEPSSSAREPRIEAGRIEAGRVRSGGPASRLERERLVEELLVLRAREGSREAFEELARHWHERLWRHAFRLTDSRDAAWDVLQDSWLGVARGLHRLEDPRAFRRWAYTIVTRTAADHLRDRPREGTQPNDRLDETLSPAAADSEEAADRDEAVRVLRGAIARLEAADRTLVSLRYLEGFELWEIASVLGLPEGTVKSRLHRVRKRLKELLERTER